MVAEIGSLLESFLNLHVAGPSNPAPTKHNPTTAPATQRTLDARCAKAAACLAQRHAEAATFMQVSLNPHPLTRKKPADLSHLVPDTCLARGKLELKETQTGLVLVLSNLGGILTAAPLANPQVVFEALAKLIKKTPDLYLLFYEFRMALAQYNPPNCAAIEGLFAELPIKKSTHDYEREALAEMSHEKAFAFAVHLTTLFESHHSAQARSYEWLFHAIDFAQLRGRRLSDFYDLKHFFRQNHSITDPRLFEPKYREAYLAALDTFEVNQLDLRMARCDYTEELACAIGQFLMNSHFVKNVHLGMGAAASQQRMFSCRTIRPLIQAMRVNSSITALDITSIEVCDMSAQALLQAVQDNPHSSLRYLWMHTASLSKVTAEKALTTLQACPRLLMATFESCKKLSKQKVRVYQSALRDIRQSLSQNGVEASTSKSAEIVMDYV